jgi:hypothetical protein
MNKVITIFFICAGFLSAQTFKAENVEGNVTAQIRTSENWVSVSNGKSLSVNTVISTGKNSSIRLSGENINFKLKSYSVLPLSRIKKMTVNDLILALAMEDMLNAPKKNEKLNSKNTAVYGAEINGIKTPIVKSDNFGIKRLNGAVQLAESGFKESAVVDAKETFRKYPETNKIAAFRIYFANILFDLGLNEDAYDDFKSIQSLKMDKEQAHEVKNKMEILAGRLLKK